MNERCAFGIQGSSPTTEESTMPQSDSQNCVPNSLNAKEQNRTIVLSSKTTPPPSKRVKYGSKKYPCFQCEKRFTRSSGLNRHLKIGHKITIPLITNIKCLDCSDSKYFANLKNLRFHLISNHGYTIDEERHVFPSMNGFLSWKKNMEEETSSSYIMRRGSKLREDCKTHFFMCHRSGLHYSSGTGIRSLKSQGSCKMGFFCTSTITATETKSGVIVNFVKQHYMHSNDASYLRLSKEEKFEIASKLLDGVSYENILEEFHSKDGNLKRSKMLTRKDIHNIKSNIESIIDLAANDTQSANSCVGNSPVVVNLSSQDNVNDTTESLPNILLPSCASEDNLKLPVQTKAELCIDEALEKLKTLSTTLSENKKEYCEEVSQEIVKKLDQLIELSRSKTLPSETPIIKPQTLFFVTPPANQKILFFTTKSPIVKPNGILVPKNVDHCYS